MAEIIHEKVWRSGNVAGEVNLELGEPNRFRLHLSTSASDKLRNQTPTSDAAGPVSDVTMQSCSRV